MSRLRSVRAITFALTLISICSGPARAEPDESLSEAQVTLFRTPHLDNVTRMSTLVYEYRRQAVEDESFSDTVTMTITDILPNGAKNVDFTYLTGERRRPFRQLSEFRGNPLIMVFLEDDVTRMSEALGGGATYMRNRIRHAFYDSAKTAPIRIDLDGRQVDGTRISISPFIGDKHSDRLREYEFKTYEFIISRDVPGNVFRIQSIVPSSSRASKPAIEETLTFSRLVEK